MMLSHNASGKLLIGYTDGMLSKREWIARKLFETYLPHERVVYGMRPEWLINPQTNNALELDLYFPDLKLAIEIDGSQHHRFTPGLQKNRAEFDAQVARDAIKVRDMPAGYRLYKFTIHDLCEYRFDPFIKNLMRELGRLPQYEHTAKPVGLYRYADRLSHERVVPAPKRKRRRAWWPFARA